MPVRIHYREDGIGLELTASGVLTGHEVFEMNKELYSGELLKRQRYQLVDCLDVGEFLVTPGQARKLAEQDLAAAKMNPDMVIAVIADNDLGFGMSRMWESFVDRGTLRTRVFRDRESAEEWLESVVSGFKRDKSG